MEAKGFGAEPHFCIFIIVRFMTSKVCIQIKIFILKLNIVFLKVLFSSFPIHVQWQNYFCKLSTKESGQAGKLIKALDMLGIQTRGGRMVGAVRSTELPGSREVTVKRVLR